MTRRALRPINSDISAVRSVYVALFCAGTDIRGAVTLDTLTPPYTVFYWTLMIASSPFAGGKTIVNVPAVEVLSSVKSRTTTEGSPVAVSL